MDARITGVWVAACLSVSVLAKADRPPDRHVGVANCASSLCHGATQTPADSHIRQDEYFVWQRQDRHAQAYKALATERGRRIAHNLGIGDPVQAHECLDCHADDAPAQQRGERFQIGDGVGCEACHGAAERWLTPHAAGFKTHQQRLAAGMYPTWDVAARARLCLSCHQGSEDRPITHAIMGAGHPPLLFEQVTFDVIEPPHYQADSDYTARKGPVDAARNWAAGQGAASQMYLAALAGGKLRSKGMFPDWVFFDCNVCHHSMNAARWQAEQPGHLRPGSVRLAATHLDMIGNWLAVADPALAARWRAAIDDLQQATMRSEKAVAAAASSMNRLLRNDVLPRIQATQLTAGQVKNLLDQVVAMGEGAQAGDYSYAEQSAMAVAVLLTEYDKRAGIPLSPDVSSAVNRVYSTVADRDRFTTREYRDALERLRRTIQSNLQ